jgi:hypothetical protein
VTIDSLTTLEALMKSKVNALSLGNIITLAFGLLLLVCPLSSQAQAKALGSGSAKPTIAIIFVADQQAAARMVRLITNKATSILKIRGLSKEPLGAPVAPDDLYGFGSCMGGCLSDVGVSWVQVIMCGASCAAAGTGVGAIVCAICVGVDVTVVVACAMGCAAYPGKYHGMLMEAIQRHQITSGSSQAKLRLQPAYSRY